MGAAHNFNVNFYVNYSLDIVLHPRDLVYVGTHLNQGARRLEVNARR